MKGGAEHGLGDSDKDGSFRSASRVLVQLRLGRNRLYACRGVKLRLTMAVSKERKCNHGLGSYLENRFSVGSCHLFVRSGLGRNRGTPVCG